MQAIILNPILLGFIYYEVAMVMVQHCYIMQKQGLHHILYQLKSTEVKLISEEPIWKTQVQTLHQQTTLPLAVLMKMLLPTRAKSLLMSIL